MNLHTHTRFSDGDFTAEQIIITAAEHNLTHIGITDHLMTDKCRSMSAGDLGNYIDVLRELRRRHRHIDVLAGVEIDTRPDHCDLENLPIDDLNRLDYVLFEFVQTREGTSLENLEPLLDDISVPSGWPTTTWRGTSVHGARRRWPTTYPPSTSSWRSTPRGRTGGTG